MSLVDGIGLIYAICVPMIFAVVFLVIWGGKK